MRKKLFFKGGFAATILTTAIFVIIIALICWTIVTIITEIISIIENLNNNSVPISEYFSKIIQNIEKYFGDGFLKNSSEKIMENITASIEIVAMIYAYIAGLFTSIPAIFTMIIVAIFSTYYFTYEFDTIKKSIVSVVSKKTHRNLSIMWHEGTGMFKKFFGSYMIIYFLTFVETLIVFLVLGVKYALFFAVLTAIADIIPVLGPATTYFPIIAIYLIKGNFYVAIGLIISYILISVIRQFIEPKIISKSIQIHPLLVLGAIYFSLMAGNIWVLLYMMILFLLYQILINVKIINPIFDIKDL